MHGLDRLDCAQPPAGAQARVVVEAANVLGAEAPSWLVAQLLGLDSAEEVIEWLQPAAPAGLVVTRPELPDDICFAHALVREAAYTSLSAQRRTDLHRRAAELLQELVVGRDSRRCRFTARGSGHGLGGPRTRRTA